jgi:hypothetical protein
MWRGKRQCVRTVSPSGGNLGRPVALGVSVKSSHRMYLELLEQTLQPASFFQLQAAKHKVLVIRDALAADKDRCEALLHKIDHLLGQEVALAANPCTLTMVALTVGTDRLLETAI